MAKSSKPYELQEEQGATLVGTRIDLVAVCTCIRVCLCLLQEATDKSEMIAPKRGQSWYPHGTLPVAGRCRTMDGRCTLRGDLNQGSLGQDTQLQSLSPGDPCAGRHEFCRNGRDIRCKTICDTDL
jgi:hypothetical protein